MDFVDREIVRVLLADGRMSREGVAREVNLSRPAVHERIKRLEEKGIIRGYWTLIDWGALGYPLRAFVWVRTTGRRDAAGTALLALADEASFVEECHRITGEVLALEGTLNLPSGPPRTDRSCHGGRGRRGHDDHPGPIRAGGQSDDDPLRAANRGGRCVSAGQPGALLPFAVLWGASFLFIRAAVHGFGLLWLVELRVGLAGVALALYALAVFPLEGFLSAREAQRRGTLRPRLLRRRNGVAGGSPHRGDSNRCIEGRYPPGSVRSARAGRFFGRW